MFKIGSNVRIRKDFPLTINSFKKNVTYIISEINTCGTSNSNCKSRHPFCPGRISIKNKCKNRCFGYFNHGFALINDKFTERKERLLNV